MGLTKTVIRITPTRTPFYVSKKRGVAYLPTVIPAICPSVRSVMAAFAIGLVPVGATCPTKLTGCGVIMNQFPLASGTKFWLTPVSITITALKFTIPTLYLKIIAKQKFTRMICVRMVHE
jgi:hypothetical protein